MTTQPARHRVQDLCYQMKITYARQELEGDVSSYLHLKQMQLDAIEDDDTSLASSIGKSMRHIREKHDQKNWMREINKQE